MPPFNRREEHPKSGAYVEVGDEVEHKGEFKKVVKVEGKGLDRMVTFEDGTYLVVGIKTLRVKDRPKTDSTDVSKKSTIEEKTVTGKESLSSEQQDLLDSAVDYLQKHMDDKGTTEDRAMGISEVQDLVNKAKEHLDKGETQPAIDKIGRAHV